MKDALLVLFGLIALLMMGYGALSIFAGSMSDDPGGGQEAATEGAWLAGLGFIALIAAFAIALGVALIWVFEPGMAYTAAGLGCFALSYVGAMVMCAGIGDLVFNDSVEARMLRLLPSPVER